MMMMMVTNDSLGCHGHSIIGEEEEQEEEEEKEGEDFPFFLGDPLPFNDPSFYALLKV